MKKQDLVFGIVLFILLLPFFPLGFLADFQKSYLYNPDHWISTSFIKFAILATMGEILGARIRTGNYILKGFGIIPKAIVWGFIGITIKVAFIVFEFGGTVFIEKYLLIANAKDSMIFKDIFVAFDNDLGWTRILTALIISIILNIMYAPVMMTFHKITDIHINENGGKLNSLFTPIKWGDNFSKINWQIQWGFIFKKTIPIFWIPAQTINFMMPSEYRIIIAALLSIMLGILLALATPKTVNK